MNNYLSPDDIRKSFKIGKTMTYQLLNEYEENGGEVIKIGKLKRVNEELFTEYLKKRVK